MRGHSCPMGEATPAPSPQGRCADAAGPSPEGATGAGRPRMPPQTPQGARPRMPPQTPRGRRRPEPRGARPRMPRASAYGGRPAPRVRRSRSRHGCGAPASTCQVLLLLFSPGDFLGMFCATNSDRKTPGKPLRRRGTFTVSKTPGQLLLFAGIPPSGPPSSSKNVYISKFVAQIEGFRKPDASPSCHTAGRPAPRTALVEEACEQRRSQRRPWHAG